MPTPRVRADYEQLTHIANQFAAQADSARRTLQVLRQHVDVLQGGDWVGKGASAFYAEMDQSVFPTISRLASALQNARQITQQISQIMKAAEDEAAGYFRLDGSGAAARAGAAGAASGPAMAGFSRAAAVTSVAAAVGGTGGGGDSLRDRVLDAVGNGLGNILFPGGAPLLDDLGEQLGLGPLASDFGRGLAEEAIDMGKGLWHLATTDQTALINELGYAISHPEELWEAFKKPYLEAIESGHPMRAFGRGALAVGTLLAGVGEAGAAGELGEAAGVAGRLGEAAGTAGRLGEAAGTAGRLGEAAGTAGRLGEAAGTAGRMGEAAGTAGRMGEAAGTAGRMAEAAADSARVAEATAGSARVSEGAGAAARSADEVAAASGDFTVVDGYTLNREGYKLGQVSIPEAATPQVLGQAVESPIRDMIAERYGFELPTKPPSATGPDVVVPAADRARVGFDVADVKPLNEAGMRKFWDQLDNWRDYGWPGGPQGNGPGSPAIRHGRAALFGYDSNGNVYMVGIWDM